MSGEYEKDCKLGHLHGEAKDIPREAAQACARRAKDKRCSEMSRGDSAQAAPAAKKGYAERKGARDPERCRPQAAGKGGAQTFGPRAWLTSSQQDKPAPSDRSQNKRQNNEAASPRGDCCRHHPEALTGRQAALHQRSDSQHFEQHEEDHHRR